jgi:hypothetical protein
MFDDIDARSGGGGGGVGLDVGLDAAGVGQSKDGAANMFGGTFQDCCGGACDARCAFSFRF